MSLADLICGQGSADETEWVSRRRRSFLIVSFILNTILVVCTFFFRVILAEHSFDWVNLYWPVVGGISVIINLAVRFRPALYSDWLYPVEYFLASLLLWWMEWIKNVTYDLIPIVLVVYMVAINGEGNSASIVCMTVIHLLATVAGALRAADVIEKQREEVFGPVTHSAIFVVSALLPLVGLYVLKQRTEQHRREQNRRQLIVDVTEKLVMCIRYYDLEMMESVLEDHEDELTPELLRSYEKSRENLAAFKPYLPSTFFVHRRELPELDSGDSSDSDSEPQIGLVRRSSVLRMSSISSDSKSGTRDLRTGSLSSIRTGSSLDAEIVSVATRRVQAVLVLVHWELGEPNPAAAAAESSSSDEGIEDVILGAASLSSSLSIDSEALSMKQQETVFAALLDMCEKNKVRVEALQGTTALLAWDVDGITRNAKSAACKFAVNLRERLLACESGDPLNVACAVVNGQGHFGTVGAANKRFLLSCPWMPRLRLLLEAARLHNSTVVSSEISSGLTGLYKTRIIDRVRGGDVGPVMVHQIVVEPASDASNHNGEEEAQEWMYQVQDAAMDVCDIVSEATNKFAHGLHDEGFQLLDSLPGRVRSEQSVALLEAQARASNAMGTQYCRELTWSHH